MPPTTPHHKGNDGGGDYYDSYHEVDVNNPCFIQLNAKRNVVKIPTAAWHTRLMMMKHSCFHFWNWPSRRLLIRLLFSISNHQKILLSLFEFNLWLSKNILEIKKKQYKIAVLNLNLILFSSGCGESADYFPSVCGHLHYFSLLASLCQWKSEDIDICLKFFVIPWPVQTEEEY